MVTLDTISVLGKLLARHVMIVCWWTRDKFFMTNLLVCIDGKEKSNIVLSSGLPFHSHCILGVGEPPRTSHNRTMSLPSSYGPANDCIGSARSLRIRGFCGGTEKDDSSGKFVKISWFHLKNAEIVDSINLVQWIYCRGEIDPFCQEHRIDKRKIVCTLYSPTTSKFITLFLVGDNLKSTLHRKSPASSACRNGKRKQTKCVVHIIGYYMNQERDGERLLSLHCKYGEAKLEYEDFTSSYVNWVLRISNGKKELSVYVSYVVQNIPRSRGFVDLSTLRNGWIIAIYNELQEEKSSLQMSM